MKYSFFSIIVLVFMTCFPFSVAAGTDYDKLCANDPVEGIQREFSNIQTPIGQGDQEDGELEYVQGAFKHPYEVLAAVLRAHGVDAHYPVIGPEPLSGELGIDNTQHLGFTQSQFNDNALVNYVVAATGVEGADTVQPRFMSDLKAGDVIFKFEWRKITDSWGGSWTKPTQGESAPPFPQPWIPAQLTVLYHVLRFGTSAAVELELYLKEDQLGIEGDHYPVLQMIVINDIIADDTPTGINRNVIRANISRIDFDPLDRMNIGKEFDHHQRYGLAQSTCTFCLSETYTEEVTLTGANLPLNQGSGVTNSDGLETFKTFVFSMPELHEGNYLRDKSGVCDECKDLGECSVQWQECLKNKDSQNGLIMERESPELYEKVYERGCADECADESEVYHCESLSQCLENKDPEFLPPLEAQQCEDILAPYEQCDPAKLPESFDDSLEVIQSIEQRNDAIRNELQSNNRRAHQEFLRTEAGQRWQESYENTIEMLEDAGVSGDDIQYVATQAADAAVSARPKPVLGEQPSLDECKQAAANKTSCPNRWTPTLMNTLVNNTGYAAAQSCQAPGRSTLDEFRALAAANGEDLDTTIGRDMRVWFFDQWKWFHNEASDYCKAKLCEAQEVLRDLGGSLILEDPIDAPHGGPIGWGSDDEWEPWGEDDQNDDESDSGDLSGSDGVNENDPLSCPEFRESVSATVLPGGGTGYRYTCTRGSGPACGAPYSSRTLYSSTRAGAVCGG